MKKCDKILGTNKSHSTKPIKILVGLFSVTYLTDIILIFRYLFFPLPIAL